MLAIGYPIGGDGLSMTKGIVSRIENRMYSHSLRNLLAVQLDAAINPGNSGGPVFYGNKIAGIAFQGHRKGENLGYIPCEVIRHFLKDIEDGRVDGCGMMGFSYAVLENPGMRAYYKMTPKQTGMLITEVNPLTDKASPGAIKVNDVMLSIDGHMVANNGNIRLANGEPRHFSYLLLGKKPGKQEKKKYCLYFSRMRIILFLSAVENGDMVVSMLSGRSFNMQKTCPVLPHREGKNPRFTPSKGFYGANEIP